MRYAWLFELVVVVMNTEEELREVFRDLERGTFLKETIDYEEALRTKRKPYRHDAVFCCREAI